MTNLWLQYRQQHQSENEMSFCVAQCKRAAIAAREIFSRS